MKWIKKFESYSDSRPNKNTVTDLSICMLLLNPTFLDSLLDKGLKGRYTSNSDVFLNDLKNMLFGNNRLKLGKIIDSTCVIDDEISKLNNYFNNSVFNIEDDWSSLVSARITARNIMDKLLLDEKLTEEMISNVFWIGPNKDKEYPEDIVLELTDGRQFSIYLNKKLSMSKSVSFNTIVDTLIEENSDRLFSETYIEKWNRLVREFARITYEGVQNNLKLHIEKFIDPNRFGSLTWFDYSKIKHMDDKYQHLGEYIPELNKNILKLQELMSLIWKDAESNISQEKIDEWSGLKLELLNSEIIEHLVVSSFSKLVNKDLDRDDDKFQMATDKIKMRLMRLMVEQIGATERNMYYLNNNGNDFYRVPEKEWFRDNYDDFDVRFDFHTDLTPNEEEGDDVNFRIRINLDEEPFMHINLKTKWAGGEMSGKLSTKVELDLADNFNYKTLRAINEYED